MANDLVPYSQALSDPASTASSLETTDVMAISREDADKPTGFKSMVFRLLTLAKKIVSGIDYSTELTETSNKTITGAINEVASMAANVDITTTLDTPAPIMTFSDGGDNIPMKSCEVAIVAQQASGTPSPSNPLPITGFSSVVVKNAGGVNILDGLTLYQGGLDDNTGVLAPNVLYRVASDYFPVTVGNVYNAFVETGKKIVCYHFYNSSKTGIGNNVLSSEVTAPTNAAYARVVFGNNDNSNLTPSDVTNARVYDTPTTPVSLGQTIYGGTAELVGGNGSKKFDISDLGDLSWSYDSTNKRFVALLTGAKLNGSSRAYTNPNSKCTNYEVIFTDREYTYNEMISGISSKNNVIWLYTASGDSYVNVKDTAYTDAPTFKTAMSGVKFVYELETPTAFTFTGANIPTLSGVNNVYADSGDVNALEYFNDKADDIASMVRLMTRT